MAQVRAEALEEFVTMMCIDNTSSRSTRRRMREPGECVSLRTCNSNNCASRLALTIISAPDRSRLTSRKFAIPRGTLAKRNEPGKRASLALKILQDRPALVGGTVIDCDELPVTKSLR